MQAIVNWYNTLSSREQIIVAGAIPIAFVIIAMMGIQETQRQRDAAKKEFNTSLKQYEWLRSGTQGLQQWQSSFGKRSLGSLAETGDLGSLLDAGIKKFRLRGNVQTEGDMWRVKLNANDGNRTMSFIEAAVGSGAAPEQIKITRTDKRGNVEAVLVFKAVM